MLINRPRPHAMESLSGYLYRVADENMVKFYNLFKLINERYKNISTIYAHQLDIFPERRVDLKRLSSLVDVSKNSIESMSFSPIYQKIGEDPSRFRAVNPELFEKKHRRFCVLCLRETEKYDLLWQVSDLKICPVHFIQLDKLCRNCKRAQPYVSDGLMSGCCPSCGALLSKQFFEQVDEKLILSEVKKYEDWFYLQDASTPLVPTIKDVYLKENEALAVSALYLSVGQKEQLIKDQIRFFKKHQWEGLLRLITKGRCPVGISLQTLLSLLEDQNISVKCFSKLIVPSSFYYSIIDGRKCVS